MGGDDQAAKGMISASECQTGYSMAEVGADRSRGGELGGGGRTRPTHLGQRTERVLGYTSMVVVRRDSTGLVLDKILSVLQCYRIKAEVSARARSGYPL